MCEYLAQELVIGVLQRLPINSIIRCRCVCGRYCPVYHMMGFGFDSVTNDYKVLRVAYGRCLNIGAVSPNVELYKLSTGVWEDLTLVAPFYDFFPRAVAGFYFNGACHWVASKGKIGGKSPRFQITDVVYPTLEQFNNVDSPYSLESKEMSEQQHILDQMEAKHDASS
ncbi:hypothetical protein HAX54_018193 [Datura stramonium]|uniref:F-box protein n=1 Tax=Datura stramonium TaxID=4076 RepID=A0ABS8ULU5_DATST|nr:hypothetical protein [Datura stramonium]